MPPSTTAPARTTCWTSWRTVTVLCPKRAGAYRHHLVRVVAAKLGIYEITQNRDTLILYSDKLYLATLKPLLKDMGRRLLVNASGKPYLSVRILPGEKPLDVMNAVFDKMAELERPQ